MNIDLNSTYDYPSARQKFGLFLTVLGVNILLFIPYLFTYDYEGGMPIGIQRYQYLGFLSILAGAFMSRLSKLSYRKYRFYGAWSILIMVSILIMSTRSFINGDNILYILNNCMLYIGIYLIGLIGSREFNVAYLNKVFIFHAMVGFIYTIYYVLTGDVATREDISATAGYSVFISGVPYYSVPWLVLSYNYQKIVGKMVTILSYISMTIIFTLWQSRIGIGVVIGLPLLKLYMLWRSQKLSGYSAIKVFTLFLLFFFSLLTIFYSYLSETNFGQRLAFATEMTAVRYTHGGTVSSTVSGDFRWEEAVIVAQNLTWDEWLIGRGIAATWSDTRAYFGEERNMVHVAYFHYIFQGGLFLLFIMLVPFYWGLKSITADDDPIKIVAGGYIVFQYAFWWLYGFPSLSLQWFLICLTIGICSKQYDYPARS